MNVVDSSCWLEYFEGSNLAESISAPIQNTDSLIVPSITLYEVFKKLLMEKDEDSALLAVAHMKQGQIIELDSDLSIYSAKISREYTLPMADSIIYATSKKYNCTLWTQDRHFKELENVKYFEKKKS